jgi:hypothetical protein
MSRSPYKMPSIFVACPYDEKFFKYSLFKKELESFPFTIEYANTNLETKHLMEKIKRLIKTADFSFFDLSCWNPNVALELGLAEGIKSNYYILVNSRLNKDVPSDIKGIQRIEYSSLRGVEGSLHSQIIQYFFKKKYSLTKDLWAKLSRHRNSTKIYDFGLRILAFLREHNAIAKTDFKEISRGLYIRDTDQTDIIETLIELKAIRKAYAREEYLLKKEIYKK